MQLKVFGGQIAINGKRRRTIVAASSQANAAKLLGISVAYLKEYFPETGCENELKAALSSPGSVMQENAESMNFEICR